MTPERLDEIVTADEDYDLELKTAQDDFNVKKLHDYCAAISNEKGGYLLFGVNDNKVIVGSKAFLQGWNKLAHQLTEHLGLRVKVYRVQHSAGRVLVFEIPRHHQCVPTKAVGGSGKYVYPIRDGESLVEMDAQTLQDIFDEKINDWSAQIIPGVTYKDLDIRALDNYRTRWAQHTHKPERLGVSHKTILRDFGLVDGDKITNAALLLFGKATSVQRHIPDAEMIFEWRNNPNDIAYGDRRNWRVGFMLIHDEIWQTVDARNTTFRYQEGFTQNAVRAYDEESIREAIINAFVHRDYTISGNSIRIKISPEEFYIENPGKLMPGVTLENILDKTAWRNRLLAESLEKVNLMERSSQGIDKIFRQSIENGKGIPHISLTHDPSVHLTIPARLVDQGFVKFLENIVNEKQATLSPRELIELEEIRTGIGVKNLRFKEKFIDLGIIERIGRGKGTKYILSRQYYTHTQTPGRHARIVGLSRDVKRAVIIEYLKTSKRVTSSELQDAMPDASPAEISRLLKGLRKDGLIEYMGDSPRWGYWQLRNAQHDL